MSHTRSSPARAWWAAVLLGVIVAIAGVIRLRLLDVPLDRDEGEYAYIAQLLLDGVPRTPARTP